MTAHSENHLTTKASRTTIRFAHVDAAGIVFYARYFEMLIRGFPGSPVTRRPLNARTDFVRPNRLGDVMNIVLTERAENGGWSYSGRLGETEHFRVRSLPVNRLPLGDDAHRRLAPAFVSAPRGVDDIDCGPDGMMSLPRYFELVSESVECWLAEALDTPFHISHPSGEIGIPTVRFETRCRYLPAHGDDVTVSLQPTKLGSRSVQFTSWLSRGSECLVENRQVIVYVRMIPGGYETIPIPKNVRAALESQLAALPETG